MKTNNAKQNNFIQFHFLTSYAPSLLNRDDVGFAKRVPFGNSTRIRVSSQCLKRHWRTNEGLHSMKNLDVGSSIHSRNIFSNLIFTPLQEDVGIPLALEATLWLKDKVFGKSKNAENKEEKAKVKAAGEKKTDAPMTLEDAIEKAKFGQIIVLGTPEIEYMLQVGRQYIQAKAQGEQALKELEKSIKENLEALGKGAVGLDASLFGRMTTSDFLARSDAAVHVAHAFTVHAERAETDYFTAVDDFETLGSAHINNSELTSSLYYGYVVIDVPLLVSNLSGCKKEDWHAEDLTLATQVIQNFLYLIATVSPGAKKGSTAPYSYSNFILAEAGNAQPCSLANAFHESIKFGNEMIESACKKLCNHVNKIENMYEFGNERAFVTLVDADQFDPIKGSKQALNMKELSLWIKNQVQGESND